MFFRASIAATYSFGWLNSRHEPLFAFPVLRKQILLMIWREALISLH